MVFNGDVFKRSCLRACFGEVGDKTFVLTVAFAVWCPWTGVRDTDDGFKARCFVFVGTMIALTIRIILLTSLVDPFFMEATFDYVSCFLLSMLALRAYIEMGRVEAFEATMGLLGDKASGRDAKKDLETDAREDLPEEGWNQAAFVAPPPLPAGTASDAMTPASSERENYGSVSPRIHSADGLLSERISDRLASLIISFVLPLITVFAVEAEDKSEVAIFLGGRSGNTDVATGAVLGLLPAVMFAVVLGYILERRLPDQWAAFLVLSILLTLALVEMSQGLLHLPFLQPPDTLAVKVAVPLELKPAGLISVAAEAWRSLRGDHSN